LVGIVVVTKVVAFSKVVVILTVPTGGATVNKSALRVTVDATVGMYEVAYGQIV